MKPSLRNNYFKWLLLLLVLSYLLLITALSAIELHEAHENNSPFREEIPEIIAFLGIMAATVPIIILAAWHIAGRLLRPLRQVLATAENIRQGNLNERIPPLPHHDELSRLADTINDAFDRYSSAVRRLENFSADASHQLRTPLTAIKSTAEVALQAERPAESYRESLGEILEQTDKLNETMDQLLQLSHLDRSMRNSFESLTVKDLIRQWVSEIRDSFDEMRITENIDLPDDCRMRGNQVLLHEAFSNLVDNARTFTPDRGEIFTSAYIAPSGQLEWRLEDSGPGIPVDDLPRVFDRFYRGQKSTHQGSGLGLAIVREIVLLHGGSIKAGRSERLGGAAFVIQLPISRSTG